jgi:hypothetical protein
MPTSMTRQKIKITSLIFRADSDIEIHRLTHFSCSFIEQIQTQSDGDPATIVDLRKTPGAPRK